jgi:hypothetical protein
MPLSLSGTTGIVTGNIAASNITTATIADLNVTTAKLADLNVTTAKLADGSVTTAKLAQSPLTLATAQTGTGSNTFFDFTGIPAGTKRISVLFSKCNQNSFTDHLVQLGTASGLQTTNYESGSNASFRSDGFVVRTQDPTYAASGIMVLATLGGNLWASTHSILVKYPVVNHAGGGIVSLSGALTQVRITSVGSGTFFATGSVNIMYEG